MIIDDDIRKRGRRIVKIISPSLSNTVALKGLRVRRMFRVIVLPIELSCHCQAIDQAYRSGMYACVRVRDCDDVDWKGA